MFVAAILSIVKGVILQIAARADEMTQWRRHLHQHPELDLACHSTSDFVVARLRDFGIDEIHTGVAETGVIAVIQGCGAGPTIGLRADMDALPIHEETGHPWQSTLQDRMHACGHDGHTTMLLGAARYLHEHRNFSGRVVLIFQPGEEMSGGGRIMVEQGVFDQFQIDEVYALHTLPGKPAGTFHTRSGPLLASVDDFGFEITGRSGHVAYPHLCHNPIERFGPLIAGIMQIEEVLKEKYGEAVVAATVARAGEVTNIVPETASLTGSVRTFSEAFREEVEGRLLALADEKADGFQTKLTYDRYYPPLVNPQETTGFAGRVAVDVVGSAAVDLETAPHLVSEDFSYMLQARPGCFLFLGQGEGAGLHNSRFDFNDAVAPIGASFFARIVETRNPVAG